MRQHMKLALLAALVAGVCAPLSVSADSGQYTPAPGPGPRALTSLRLDVTPKDTHVYVDGYYVGIVDDFDGLFHRLRVPSGEREVVLYLQGYRTIRQTLKLRPRGDYKIREQMVKLAPGESSEPPPAPPAGAAIAPEQQPAPAEAPLPPAARPPRPGRQLPPGRPAEGAGFGTLAIRVQPAGADVIIDGERWQGPEGQPPLVVQLAAGPHRIEIRKEGYETYSGNVQVREGEATPLNVSLPPRR